jgi:hypothetical protein
MSRDDSTGRAETKLCRRVKPTVEPVTISPHARLNPIGIEEIDDGEA